MLTKNGPEDFTQKGQWGKTTPRISRAGRPGGRVRGVGPSRSELVRPDLSLLSSLGIQIGILLIFAQLSRLRGIIQKHSFPLFKTSYNEHSRKGPGDNPDLSPKNGNPPGLPSLKYDAKKSSHTIRTRKITGREKCFLYLFNLT